MLKQLDVCKNLPRIGRPEALDEDVKLNVINLDPHIDEAMIDRLYWKQLFEHSFHKRGYF